MTNNNQHPSLDDGGAGIVEQPEPFCEATGPLPTTDPASRAIAAHKTPWKISDDTQLRASELRDIIAAFSIDRVSLTLAVERYGLRMYKAGADFTLGCMSGGVK